MSLPRPHTILIVDDQVEIRESLAEILHDEGFCVITAANGREGLQAARQERPCLVLLDLMMPEMNGWEFAAALRADPLLDEIPILILSGAGDLSTTVLLLKARDYLEKPVNIPRLLTLARMYC